MKKRTRSYLLLTLSAAIWGIGLPLIKKSYDQASPMEFLFHRYAFATVVSLPVVIIFWSKLKFKIKDLPELIGIGMLAGVISHILLYVGLDKTSAIEASLLGTLTPIFIVIGGGFFLKEIVTRSEKIGIAIAFLGSIVVVVEPFFNGDQGFNLNHALGNLMVLANCITWGAAMLWMKKVADKYHPFTIAFTSFVTAAVAYYFLVGLTVPDFTLGQIINQPLALTASLYQGILGSVIALLLYQLSQKFIEASEATLFSYLIPLFSIPLAMIWLGEMPTPAFIFGGLIVILGLIVAEKRWKE